jgi:hypothetical protein
MPAPAPPPERAGSDWEQARRMIAEAGYSLSADMMNVCFAHLTNAPKRKNLMVMYADDMAGIGNTSSDVITDNKPNEQRALVEADVMHRATSDLKMYPARCDIQALIESEIANQRTKGIVVGVVDKNGRHIFSARTLSDNDPRKPDGDTVFETASVTKDFSTTLLVQAGLDKDASTQCERVPEVGVGC